MHVCPARQTRPLICVCQSTRQASIGTFDQTVSCVCVCQSTRQASIGTFGQIKQPHGCVSLCVSVCVGLHEKIPRVREHATPPAIPRSRRHTVRALRHNCPNSRRNGLPSYYSRYILESATRWCRQQCSRLKSLTRLSS